MRYITGGLVMIITIIILISRRVCNDHTDRSVFGSAGRLCIRYIPEEYKDRFYRLYRKNRVQNHKLLCEEADEVLSKLMSETLRYIFLASALFLCLSFIPEKEVVRSVMRPEYGEGVSHVEIGLLDTDDEEVTNYTLEVHPREYTDDEFDNLARETEEYIRNEFMGRNISADSITEDMNLMTKSPDGTLNIVWSSDDPLVINSEGKVMREELTTDEVVHLTAVIKDTYHEHKTELEVTVLSRDKTMTDSDRAKDKILNIERESRTNGEFVIPDNIGEVEVIKEEDSMQDKLRLVYFLVMVLVIVITYLRINRMKESGNRRDEELKLDYYGFVNRVTLFIGAGMTIQESLRTSVKGHSGRLSEEVDLTLNMIASGVPETKAYLQMGRSIGIQEYMRFTSLVAQNLNYGNSNLIKLLDQEVKQSYVTNRENIRKKGEQASEKLIVPTLLLMIVVIGIIVYPALTGI